MTQVRTALRRGVPLTRVRRAATAGRAVLAARSDPDLFLRLCLTDPTGRPIDQAPVHRELQAFLTAHRTALVEMPRDHGKTTQACGRIVWELGRNPALRVKLVCATDALAAERTRYLRGLIETSPAVRAVFPHLRPARPWTAHAFTVTRPAETVGPSVAAFGVGTGSTGARADLLVCDDVVDVRALRSKADRDRVADFFTNNLMNLLEPEGRFWGLCTPWHPDDLNARLKANPAYALFRRAVGPDLEPVWPEKWPARRLRRRMTEVGAAAFARGYRLVPLSEADLAIRPEWVRLWTDARPRDAFETVVLAVDPAVTEKQTADASALVVLGLLRRPSPSPPCSWEGQPLPLPPPLNGEGERRGALSPPSLSGKGAGGLGGDPTPAESWNSTGTEVRCLEATARRLAAPELVDAIDATDRRWRPDVILFESNAGFAAVRDLLARHARFGPKVRGVTQSRSKKARVAAFAVVVQNGTFQLRGDGSGEADPAQTDIYDEMTCFPFADHDDLVDAAATGTAYLLDRPEPRIWV